MKIKKRNLREEFKELDDREFYSAQEEYNSFIDKVLGNIAFGISILVGLIQLYLVLAADKVLYSQWAPSLVFPRMFLIACCFLVLFSRLLKVIKIRGLYLMHIFLIGAFFMTAMVIGITGNDPDSIIVWFFLVVFVGGILPTSTMSSILYIIFFTPLYVLILYKFNGVDLLVDSGYIVINTLAIGGFSLLIKYHFHWMIIKQFYSKKLIAKMTEERVSVESLKRLNREKDEFLATTAHELRTPLNGIIGLIDTYKEGGSRDGLEIASTSAKRLSFLINDIVDCSKLKNHKLEIAMEPVNLSQVINISLSLLNPLIGSKKIEVITNIHNNNASLLGDENRVLQVLNNIIGNAIKYTNEGQITISTREINGNVEIEVKDTGIGIDSDKLDLIFNNYTMFGEDKNVEGTGIGLYFAKELMALHNGNISVESTKGSGSIFTLSFIRGNDSEAIKEVRTKALDRFIEPEYIPGRELIAIVDDHPLNLRTFSNYLSPLYNVVLYSNGNDFLEDFESGKIPDLVILDLVLPDINGIDICSRIRKLHTRNDLPVIMITAGTKEKDMEEGLKVGANEFLHKPVFKDALRIRVNNQMDLLRRHKAMIESESIISFIESLVEVSDTSSLEDYIESYSEKLELFLASKIDLVDPTYRDRINQTISIIESRVTLKPVLAKLLEILTKYERKETIVEFCERHKLSERQRELLLYIFKYSIIDNNSLAEYMNTTSSNITSTLHRIYKKVGSESKAELVKNLRYLSEE